MLETMITSLQEAYGASALALAGGTLVGMAFGWIAEASGFCLRSAVVESARFDAGRDVTARPYKTVQFAVAIAAATAATQLLVYAGILDLGRAAAVASPLNVTALIAGGLAFGVGMVLARGCVGRLLVLSATGNLRAVATLLIIAVTAYATMRGALSYARTGLESLGPSIDQATLASATGLNPAVIAGIVVASLVAAIVVLARRTGWKAIAIGAAIGSLIGAAWFVTGVLAFDEFEPKPPAAISFTAPVAETLQYVMIATGDSLRYTIALVAGVLVGAFASASVGGRLRLQGFLSETAPLRYAAGGLLMGFGGVTAMGCTVGQGLSGVSTLAIGPFIALAAIIAGARFAHWLDARGFLAATRPKPALAVVVPAE